MPAAFFIDFRHGGAISADRAVCLMPEIEAQGRADLEGTGFDQGPNTGAGQEMNEAYRQAFSLCKASEGFPVASRGQGPEEIKIEATR
jgi:hypothetical protein